MSNIGTHLANNKLWLDKFFYEPKKICLDELIKISLGGQL